MDLSGLVLGATYNNGDPVDIAYGDGTKESIVATGFTSEEIGNIDVTISYTEGEITKSAILKASVVKTEVDEATGEKTVTKIDDETEATVATTTDADGNVTKTVTTVTKEDGSTEETTTDSEGNITKTVTTVTGEDGTVTVTTENADGSKEIVEKKEDGTSTETTIKTDDKGTVTETAVSKDKDGNTTGKVVKVTTADGKVTTTTYDASGKETGKTEVTLSKIEITAKPTNLTYTVGEKLETAGIKVTATYSDGKTEDVTTKVTYSGFDSSAAKDKVTVTVTYGGKTASFDVKIEATKVKSIAITTSPTKLTYTVGNKFDPAGIKVTATYTDGKTEDVTSKLTDKSYTGFDSSKAAEKVTVTVTYEGKTATFDVKIEAKAEVVLNSIEITTPPTKTEYTVGDKLDTTGLKVTAKYSDKTEKDVTASVTITGFDSSTVSDKVTVTVTYEGKTASFDIVIKANAEYSFASSKIVLKSNPYSDTGNYQATYEVLPGTYQAKKDDIVKITIKGKANKAMTGLQVVLINNGPKLEGDGYYWEELSAYTQIAESVEAGELIDKTISIKVTKDAPAAGAKYCEVVINCGSWSASDTDNREIVPEGVLSESLDVATAEPVWGGDTINTTTCTVTLGGSGMGWGWYGENSKDVSDYSTVTATIDKFPEGIAWGQLVIAFNDKEGEACTKLNGGFGNGTTATINFSSVAEDVLKSGIRQLYLQFGVGEGETLPTGATYVLKSVVFEGAAK